ncbi:MAG: alpha/beta fold hydrolase [Acidimicrobiia bacterium]|nr:alpha/beta fold hydrolase [Acidimicrobiia bacterium]MCC5954380.1 alpha/beta fold hydrolase [Acidimicrobiia bacterium]
MSTATAPDGTTIAYSVSGPRDAEPVLMIQGLGADSRGWVRQRRAFARGHRVVVMDNRGVGRSDRPEGPYDLEVMAADAVAVLDAEGIGSAHVMGASMGGVIAQILGVRSPERVRSLTLACTACRHLRWRLELLAEWRELALESGMGELSQQAARWLVGPRMLRRFRPAIDLLGPLAMDIPPEVFVAQIDAIVSMDDGVREELGGVAAPTLAIVGSQDILTPVGDSEEIVDLVPDAELAVVIGAAHGFMVEQAGAYNRTVLGFIERVRALGDAEVA